MSFDKILTLQQILESENNFIAKNSEKILIEEAGRRIGEFLSKNYKNKKFCFLCGPGNNGKDGKIASNFLSKEKIINKVFYINKTNRKLDFSSIFNDFDILVDCIFGTGLNRELKGFHKNIIDAINISKKTVISIDTPSGLECDTGQILGKVVNANITLCMGFFKPAHFLIPGKKFCGKKKNYQIKFKSPKKHLPKNYFKLFKNF